MLEKQNKKNVNVRCDFLLFMKERRVQKVTVGVVHNNDVTIWPNGTPALLEVELHSWR